MTLKTAETTDNTAAAERLRWACHVFDIEIEALIKTRNALDSTFLKILDKIVECKGKVVVTGMGKPGHIARKLAATFSSLGTPSFCLHPAEAMHGDLGMISPADLVLAISYSGESDEIIKIIPNIKMIGAEIVAITGNPTSTLAKAADIVQVLPPFQEACHLGLAPTSSTTAALCFGDALAATASKVYGFREQDFGRLHPAGSLGKKLILKVEDLMAKGEENPYVDMETPLIDAITVMSHKGLGMVSIVDREMRLRGIITDGDLRRLIERRIDLYAVCVEKAMTPSPLRTSPERLAIDALRYIRQHKINNLPVVDTEDHLVGTITWQQIIRAGIVV